MGQGIRYRLSKGHRAASQDADPELAGDDDENCNGNGFLMRILPVAVSSQGNAPVDNHPHPAQVKRSSLPSVFLPYLFQSSLFYLF
jgi:hypothetical protein